MQSAGLVTRGRLTNERPVQPHAAALAGIDAWITYLEITPHSRIVYDNAFEDNKGGAMNLQSAGRMVMTTTFVEKGGRTTVTVPTLFATVAMKEEYLGVGMVEGIQSGFDQLELLALELWHG